MHLRVQKNIWQFVTRERIPWNVILEEREREERGEKEREREGKRESGRETSLQLYTYGTPMARLAIETETKLRRKQDKEEHTDYAATLPAV